MQLSRPIAMSFLASLIFGAAQLFFAQSGSAHDGATINSAMPTYQLRLAQAPTARPAPAAPSAPQRTETTVYDSWTVTCQENPSAQVKKVCLANMRVLGQNQQVLLNWQFGYNRDGKYVTAAHVPAGMSIKKDDQTLGGGLLIANGVELKLGSGPARRLSYFACNPQQCFAELPIDDAFIKDALASTTATLTLTLPGAGAVPLEVPTKGIDKAIALTRTR
jgi:invasion protein IalB